MGSVWIQGSTPRERRNTRISALSLLPLDWFADNRFPLSDMRSVIQQKPQHVNTRSELRMKEDALADKKSFCWWDTVACWFCLVLNCRITPHFFYLFFLNFKSFSLQVNCYTGGQFFFSLQSKTIWGTALNFTSLAITILLNFTYLKNYVMSNSQTSTPLADNQNTGLKDDLIIRH